MLAPLVTRTTNNSGSVAIVELNRPEALNALSSPLMRALNKELNELLADERTKVLILTGHGKFFCAGADLAEMAGYTHEDVRQNDFIKLFSEVLPSFPLPIIAAVNGAALGGGLELAMMTDVILVSTLARLGQPEISVGTIPGIGATQRLPRLVGRARAMEMILSGRVINAEEAVRIGLAVSAHDPDILIPKAQELAETMARFSRPLLEKAKQAILISEETSLCEGLRREKDLFYSTFALDDRLEGMTAFLQKRPPVFKNR